MAIIGSFGPLIFHVSSKRVLTYNELEETSKGRWANHEPLNNYILSEFLGAGQDEKTFKMVFTPMLGVNPDISYELLRKYVRTGQHFPIIFGGIPMSNANWYIDSIESISNTFSPAGGKILWREVTVNVKEYH